MKCIVCKKLGEKSEFWPTGFGATTLIAYRPFYDEDGKFHSHDPNKTGSYYNCSNGHKYSKSFYDKCPQGDYPKQKPEYRFENPEGFEL